MPSRTPNGYIATIRSGWLLIISLLLATPAFGAVYQYQGAGYTMANGSYSLGDSISGSFTIVAPLPTLMPLTDITGLLQSFSFRDLVQTRSHTNSIICSFSVATDAIGDIINWSVSVREDPFPGAGMNYQALDITTGSDLSGTGTATATACDPMLSLNIEDASSPTGGTWNSASTPPPSPTSYQYTGQAFTSADAPYTLADRITGAFTLNGPLPPFMPKIDISGVLTNISFTDGQQIRTLANSELCIFEVGTDGNGNVTDWTIVLREQPFPGNGNPINTLDTGGNANMGNGSDLGGTFTAGPNACDNLFGGTPVGQVLNNPGSWTSAALPPVVQQTYNYTGPLFDTVSGPYTTANRITGSVTFDGRLPPFMPRTELNFAVSDFSFTDGVVQTRTPANSAICSFELATDGVGNISYWSIVLREAPFPGVSNPMQTLDVKHGGHPGPGADIAGSSDLGASQCADFAVNLDAGSVAQRGSWAPVTAAGEALYTYTGEPYAFAEPPYQLGDMTTGGMTLAAPLPPNALNLDLTDALSEFLFTDGQETRAEDNSLRCRFTVSTNAAGNIIDWSILLREPGPADPQHSLDIQNQTSITPLFSGDIAGSGPAVGCGETVLTPFASSSQPGSWMSPLQALRAVPTLSWVGLVLLAMGIGVIASLRRRKVL